MDVVREQNAAGDEFNNKDYDSEDNIPLKTLQKRLQKVDCSDSSVDDLDADPPFGICEVRRCKEEVWAACDRCLALVCFDHFHDDVCLEHGRKKFPIFKIDSAFKTSNVDVQNAPGKSATFVRTAMERDPESFSMDGETREVEFVKVRRSNQQKLAKALRNSGKAYISTATKKRIQARHLGDRCDSENCRKYKKKCYEITEEDRRNLFDFFNGIGNLHSQREFLVRHLRVTNTVRKTTKKETSRRLNTITYTLTKDKKSIVVCKKLFLSTFGINERMCRTALAKVNEGGVIEKEKRGGRQGSKEKKESEANMRHRIKQHIDRFPKVESHFCRAKTSKMYLHPDLSLPKIYFMFLEDLQNQESKLKCSYHTYRRVFKEQNLSFLSPKKDQCSLCLTYLEGDEQTKENLKIRYDSHIVEKTAVRKKKAEGKQQAIEDKKVLCGVFDLQQVIYVPISKQSAIFYKSRLSNFNFTFYDVASKDCFCFVWNESVSKRGSSEIATCLFKVLGEYDKKNVERVCLFADGCYGQNKNSIIAAMLLYSLSKLNRIQEISLCFFETNHGQNEGDSAHSAISSAISCAGDIFIPSQLYPVIKLARRKHPYKVIVMKYTDFIDFKLFSKDLRILSVRKTDGGEDIKWPNIMEIMVNKKEPMKLFLRNSHIQCEYDSITLKRFKGSFSVSALNQVSPKIAKNKYEDLVALCSGVTPVIRDPEFQQFFLSLPHDVA